MLTPFTDTKRGPLPHIDESKRRYHCTRVQQRKMKITEPNLTAAAYIHFSILRFLPLRFTRINTVFFFLRTHNSPNSRHFGHVMVTTVVGSRFCSRRPSHLQASLTKWRACSRHSVPYPSVTRFTGENKPHFVTERRYCDGLSASLLWVGRAKGRGISKPCGDSERYERRADRMKEGEQERVVVATAGPRVTITCSAPSGCTSGRPSTCRPPTSSARCRRSDGPAAQTRSPNGSAWSASPAPAVAAAAAAGGGWAAARHCSNL